MIETSSKLLAKMPLTRPASENRVAVSKATSITSNRLSARNSVKNPAAMVTATPTAMPRAMPPLR